MTREERQELAYWITLAFRLEREPRRMINGLVLTAHRREKLGLRDLVLLEERARPASLARYAGALDRLLDAEGRVSAQAFLVERVLSMGARIVPITDASYPPHVARSIGVDRAPTVLTTLGDPGIWSRPGVAISGSRKAGERGLQFARVAARAVAEAGEVIVCGLAAGVDREALEGALEAGGRVIGIAPEGILHSRWTRRQEIRDGRLAIVSQFAPDDRWSAGRAMARNRTIAAFSQALVIADCVASGGTTDQLEVHRAVGLPVYVRRGVGQGALVDELCRRPQVTAWDWDHGAVTWPPPIGGHGGEAARSLGETDCQVTIADDRVSIRLEAPLQLEFGAIVATIEAEYRRAVRGSEAEPERYSARGEEVDARVGGASEEVGAYDGGDGDSVLVALGERAQGMTSKEIAEATGMNVAKVRTRIRELKDAGMVRDEARHRYVRVRGGGDAGARAVKRGTEVQTSLESLLQDAGSGDLRGRRR